MLDRWGADALRDSDGTKLDAATKALDAKIYTTYFVARGHNEFAWRTSNGISCGLSPQLLVMWLYI